MKTAHPKLTFTFSVLFVASLLTGCESTPVAKMEIIHASPAPMATPELHLISTGEYDTNPTRLFPPRKYCYTNVQEHARTTCGNRPYYLWHIGVQPGGKCGYNYYVFVCMNP